MVRYQSKTKTILTSIICSFQNYVVVFYILYIFEWENASGFTKKNWKYFEFQNSLKQEGKRQCYIYYMKTERLS